MNFIYCSTGPTLLIERVSPEVIILRPPNRLVIEVRATGDYDRLQWTKETASFIVGSHFPNEYPNYFEMYVKDSTTASDEGIYRCQPVLGSGPLSYTVIPAGGVDFGVIFPSKLLLSCSIIIK